MASSWSPAAPTRPRAQRALARQSTHPTPDISSRNYERWKSTFARIVGRYLKSDSEMEMAQRSSAALNAMLNQNPASNFNCFDVILTVLDSLDPNARDDLNTCYPMSFAKYIVSRNVLHKLVNFSSPQVFVPELWSIFPMYENRNEAEFLHFLYEIGLGSRIDAYPRFRAQARSQHKNTPATDQVTSTLKRPANFEPERPAKRQAAPQATPREESQTRESAVSEDLIEFSKAPCENNANMSRITELENLIKDKDREIEVWKSALLENSGGETKKQVEAQIALEKEVAQLSKEKRELGEKLGSFAEELIRIKELFCSTAS